MSYRNWLVRPALFAGIGMTLFGNLDNAQASWGGYLSHGWAPIAYLITFETLIRSTTLGVKRWISGGLVLSIAAVAMVISFNTLRAAAESWGWDAGSAWLFPVIVDLMVIVLSLELAWSKESVSVDEVLERWVDPISLKDEKTISTWGAEYGAPEASTVAEVLSAKDEKILREWAAEISAPTSPAPIRTEADAERMQRVNKALRSPRSPWDVSRVAEMAIAGEPFSVAKETGIGQSTYANVLRVAKLLREDPRRDLSTAGKLPSGEVVSAMRQRLVKA